MSLSLISELESKQILREHSLAPSQHVLNLLRGKRRQIVGPQTQPPVTAWFLDQSTARSLGDSGPRN